MPKVASYTPAWLCRPAPGNEIFTTPTIATSFKVHSESAKRNAKPGPRRTIARRGTEVFVAIGKEIRWADLIYMKESWEEKQSRQRGMPNERQTPDEVEDGNEGHAQGYRVRLGELSSSRGPC
jgi:nucleoporin NUP82